MNLKLRMKESVTSIRVEWYIIFSLAVVKLLIHLFTSSNFELHRDAYLYYAQSRHLAWGYFSVPPVTAVITRLATILFGNTTFGMRFFPALAGSVNVIIIGMAVLKLGGKRIAVALACLSYILSPAYLHTNALLQPVSFDHFFWILSGYLILLMIINNDPVKWIWIGITFGLGFLNKYSMVFLFIAFAISLLLTRHRNLIKSRYLLIGLSLGGAIIFPNLVWQAVNNWPVLQHMSELNENQLIHVRLSDFIIEQFLMNAQALFLWLGALMVLLFYSKEKKYRLFGLIYILVIALLIIGKGKSYYTLGAYPILFAFGAYFTEKYITKYLRPVFVFLILNMLLALYVSLSFDGIPFISFEKALKTEGYRWEDGTYHDLPQDMADMTGWKDIGQKVCDIFLELDEEGQNNCDIFCYHYGQAGAVMFYGKKIGIPQPVSFNDSFVSWAPDSLTKKYMIWVHYDNGNRFDPDTLLRRRFNKVELKSTIDNKYFRENGTRIFLCESPTGYFKQYYSARIIGLKESFGKQ